jgi:hypothetical protein
MRCFSVLTLILGLTWTLRAADPVDPDHAAKMAKGLDVFKKHVKPLLQEKCLKCHGGRDKIENAFDLSDREHLLKGGDAGPAVLPGKARDSLFYKLVAHQKEPHMPHEAKKLPDDAIARIAEWIDLGAPYDEPLIARKAAGAAWTQKTIAPEAREHWAFQPLRKPTPPALPPQEEKKHVQNDIDRFILTRLREAGLKPNAPADKRTLLRRAYFDLIGLPPTPEEADAFLKDAFPDAWEKLIDRLLASQHFGERWGRYWLDLARFAESHGFEHDYDRPSAYHYRDFVIKAINDDLPYTTFVKWQLAGDELAPNNNEALKATGFLAAGVHPTQITKKEVAKHRYDELDDMLSTTTTTFLGLTVGCARCHDHKYDAIPQADYYRMLSAYTTTVRSEIDMNLDPEGYKKAKAAFDKEHEPFAVTVAKFEKEQLPPRKAKLDEDWSKNPDRAQVAVVDLLSRRAIKLSALEHWRHTTDAEWLKLKRAELEHLKKSPKPNIVKALISSEGLPAVRLHTQGEDFFPETHFLRRGDPEQKEAVATLSYLQVLMTTPDGAAHWPAKPPAGWRTSYRRTAFANWLTDTDYGAGQLLARVIVNRLWQHHMGRGLVATPSDFGTRGEPPTHPELLDFLANELIKSGWRLKPIHKLIMLSATYQQSSQTNEAGAKQDPDNRLLWKHPRQRLEAEVIRDALLAVSGQLDPKMFGPGTLDEKSTRRSIYFTIKRSKLMPMMVVFDAPEALVSVGDRPTTTIAPQALLLMNNPQVRGYAKSFAKRAAIDEKTPLDAAIRNAYRIALAREPSAAELSDALTFVQEQVKSYAVDARQLALADFCQVLMCLNEFVYVE